MAETWKGIYPITSFVREALERKRAQGPANLSAEEETLLTVVEFWAAAAHGTLHQYVEPDVRRILAVARRAFAALGAVRVVSLLRVAGEELDGSPTPEAKTAVIDQLDERLARTDDNIEDLVARYAGALDRSNKAIAAQ
jgi:hypothetical protein